MASGGTQLRFAYSKDPEVLMTWVSTLPYKIEIKGNPYFAQKRWYLWFTIPCDNRGEIPGGNLDG